MRVDDIGSSPNSPIPEPNAACKKDDGRTVDERVARTVYCRQIRTIAN